MDFTIITPNLNYGRFLGDCLESVRDQDGVAVEHLVLDGGSDDDSEAVVGRFPHAVWNQEPDDGMSDAINRGFGRAQGDWVMWLNADDRLKPGALAEVKRFAGSRPDADVIYGSMDFVDEAGRTTRPLKLPAWSPFISIHHCCYIPSTACFFRRPIVTDEGHRLRRDFHCVMDGEFYARLDKVGKRFVYLPVRLAEFRLHGDNASLRHLGRDRDMERIVAAERQHVESRAIRRAYGITLFSDPYLNGFVDGGLWLVARAWKGLRKWFSPMPREPEERPEVDR